MKRTIIDSDGVNDDARSSDSDRTGGRVFDDCILESTTVVDAEQGRRFGRAAARAIAILQKRTGSATIHNSGRRIANIPSIDHRYPSESSHFRSMGEELAMHPC